MCYESAILNTRIIEPLQNFLGVVAVHTCESTHSFPFLFRLLLAPLNCPRPKMMLYPAYVGLSFLPLHPRDMLPALQRVSFFF